MAQGILPFKYEIEKETTGMTALAGLPVYLDMAKVMGLSKSIRKHLNIRCNGQGWSDSQMVVSLVLLNLAGGDCVDDIKKIEADDGFCEVLKKSEMHGLRRKVRREMMRHFRKENKRSVPSSTSIFRYLAMFHDKGQEKFRQPEKAFIPAPNTYLKGLTNINSDMVSFFNYQRQKKIATLDMDATLVATNKDNAYYCYKGFKAYQPLNTWWAEQEMILHTEFRDGNVPAGYQQLRVFKEALACLPEGVEKVRLRSDTAGYQHNLMKYCETGSNKRFGRMEFAIGCIVSKEFKKAVAQIKESEWKPIYKIYYGEKHKTDSQWAEVCYVPNAIGHSKNGQEYRFLAKRQKLTIQQELPGMESQLELPFPTIEKDGSSYKVFGIATNMDWEGERLIHWLHERCGKSEEAHSIMKEGLAGGKLPSDDFGENAAWWSIMILALNLNTIMKKLAMGRAWETKQMKGIRFSFICLPGRVVKKSRSLIIRLCKNNPGFKLLVNARKEISMLKPLPSG